MLTVETYMEFIVYRVRPQTLPHSVLMTVLWVITNAREEEAEAWRTPPGPGLGRALGIQRNKPPVCLRELSQSWMDPDPFGSTDSSSAYPLPSKRAFRKYAFPSQALWWQSQDFSRNFRVTSSYVEAINRVMGDINNRPSERDWVF